MSFEPQKFFIGLVDFFSIFLPGAALAYVVKDSACSVFAGAATCPPINTVETALVFLFGAYLLGHLAFLLSAALDDWVYDPLRALTEWGQIARKLAKGAALSPRRLRQLAGSDLLFGRDADNAVIQAQRIKARALNALEGEDAVNAFQWCKARLMEESAAGLAAVQRFEADSKFFRSLVVVLGALTVVYAVRHQWLAAGWSLLGIFPALWRYIDQRFKSTQQAYWLILALDATKAKPTTAPRSDGLSHAGGVVYHQSKSATTVMLVEASKARDDRVLPKGHIEAGEDPRVTAVREIREETGHWARVTGWLGDLPLNEQPDAPLVRWFLLELLETPKEWRPEDRQHEWLSFDKARQEATYPETRELLDRAAKKLKLSPGA